MPSTFTPDPTSGLSPSSVPGPTTVPILTLPSDGDADNAASVAQAFEATANEIAWLKSRRARAGAWAEPIAIEQNARLQKRAYVDHMGNRQFRGIEIDQDWRDWLAVSNWPTSGTLGNPWFAFVTTGTVSTRGPDPGTPVARLFPTLKLTPPTSAAERSTLMGPAMWYPTDDIGAALKWSAALDSVGSNRTHMIMGLGDGPSGAGGSAPTYGAWFEKAATDTNWQCKVNGTAGASASDSGVPPVVNAFQELRIDIVGPNVSDDSAGHALFFIDGGAPVAELAMPGGTGPFASFWSAKTTTTGGAAVSLYLGPIVYRQNTAVDAL